MINGNYEEVDGKEQSNVKGKQMFFLLYNGVFNRLSVSVHR